MSHKPGHWLESKVNPGWWYGYGPGNPNPTNQPPPEPGMTPNITNRAEYDRNVNRNQTQAQNNPVTRTFVSRVPYYRQSDGTTVPAGAELHEHADGTIMIGHDPNQMGEIVTRNQPRMSQLNNRPPITTQSGMATMSGTTRPTRRRNNLRNQNNEMAPYYVYGTNQPYSGMVLSVGGKLFSTRGGTLEGTSVEVIPTSNRGNPNVQNVRRTVSSPTSRRGSNVTVSQPRQAVNTVIERDSDSNRGGRGSSGGGMGGGY